MPTLNRTQVAEIVNLSAQETLGEIPVQLNEDLSNVVDMGKQILDSDKVDTYTRKLVNHVGRVVVVDRPYSAKLPSLYMDSWEFGSVLEKISIEMPEATENESWELNHGEVYEQDIFYQPKVSVKFYNKYTTFEIPMSITDRQLKQSFTNGTQLIAFVSAIYTAIDNKLALATENLTMRAINNMISATVYDEYQGGEQTTKSGVRAVNLFYLYKQANPESTLTATNCIYSPEFIRFASYIIGMYPDRLERISKIFNAGGMERHTPKDRLHILMLSEFSRSANVYLQSDTFHDEFTKLPEAETVPYWQGSGQSYAFADTSKISVKNAENNTVTVSGVLCCMFDRYACGVTNFDKRTTTHYNSKAEFQNFWYKQDAGYFNDMNENFVVFFVA